MNEPAGKILVIVGYLITHEDGFEARLGPDKTRAENYVIRTHGAKLEPLYVLRPASIPDMQGDP